jgi:hypothetical protein
VAYRMSQNRNALVTIGFYIGTLHERWFGVFDGFDCLGAYSDTRFGFNAVCFASAIKPSGNDYAVDV